MEAKAASSSPRRLGRHGRAEETAPSRHHQMAAVPACSWPKKSATISPDKLASLTTTTQPRDPAAAMLCYADHGFFSRAQAVWTEILHSSSAPGADAVSRLMDAYARLGRFDEILRVAREMASRDANAGHVVYSLAVSCFGKAGQLRLMEDAVREMVARGFKVDSVTGNAFVEHYAAFGSIAQMEAAYRRLKKSRILIEKGAIRAMASAYISERKHYDLGEFVKDVGLRRRSVGNLLWNLLLLSFAADFRMKSLQREFLGMLDAGFSPDLTTFNIRALAFSRMCMFWDLHLSVEHMRRDRVLPDLVTCGCFVDAYLERRLARNLSFALRRMDVDRHEPAVATDALVFEAFGKGDFHASSEALLERAAAAAAAPRRRRWSYSRLLNVYLKKQYRSNQIFWNY